MKRFEPTIWTTPVALTLGDAQRLARAIAEEIRYYNGLIAGLNGPQRTMPDTFKTLTGRLEQAFGAVAASGRAVSSCRAEHLPGELAAYRDLLFENDRPRLDTKTRMLLDVAAAPAVLPPETRRAMAVEMLKAFREQSAALTSTLHRNDQVYRRAFEMLVPIDTRVKRHLQMPRAALRVDESDAALVLRVPGVAEPLRLPPAPLTWNIAVLRPDATGWNLELRRESAPYLVRLFDPVPSRRRKAQAARKSGAVA